MRSRKLIQFVLTCSVSVAMASCGIFGSVSGGKDSPDEFAVVTKAPLVIPPDFNLRPPTAGAAPTNQLAPTQAAQAALFNSDPAIVAESLPATMSPGERMMLARAGVQNTDPAIRQEIASDANATRAADEGFTNSLLFGALAPPSATPVDADSEAHRIDAQKAGGTVAAPPPAAPPPDEKKGSWLSDLFDW